MVLNTKWALTKSTPNSHTHARTSGQHASLFFRAAPDESQALKESFQQHDHATQREENTERKICLRKKVTLLSFIHSEINIQVSNTHTPLYDFILKNKVFFRILNAVIPPTINLRNERKCVHASQKMTS